MSKLNVEINVNLQLLCIVVSVALNGEFERFGGICVITMRYKKETRAESSFSTAPAQSHFFL